LLVRFLPANTIRNTLGTAAVASLGSTNACTPTTSIVISQHFRSHGRTAREKWRSIPGDFLGLITEAWPEYLDRALDSRCGIER
jgi:hypothetical protein